MNLYLLDNGYIEGSCRIFYREGEYAGAPRITFPVNCYLIQTDAGKNLLFDTGVWPGGIRAKTDSCRYQTRKQTVEAQLALLGLMPGDIDAVLLSHLHYDHAGGLFLFAGKDFYVSRREYALATGENPPAAYVPTDYAVPGRWHLLDGDGEIFPGVEAVMLPGHTPGMMGLLLRLSGRNILLPQDAVYAADNYFPACMLPGLLGDESAYRASLAKLRGLQQETGAELIFGHDAAQRAGLPLAPARIE